MSMRTVPPFLALTMAVILSACGSTRYSHVIPFASTQEAPSAYDYVSSVGGPMLMEVYSPPAGVTAEEIAGAFPPSPRHGAVRFVTALPPDARRDLAAYRFVLVFSAPVAFDGDDACVLSAGGGERKFPAAGSGDLLAAFCREDRSLRQVRVSGPDLAFPGGVWADPAQSILSQVSGYLVPYCGGGGTRRRHDSAC